MIISAAGSGTRMGPNGKLHLLIRGESVLMRTVRKFVSLDWIDEMVIVVRQDDIEELEKEIAGEGLPFPFSFVPGERNATIQSMRGFVPRQRMWRLSSPTMVRGPLFVRETLHGWLNMRCEKEPVHWPCL